MSIVHIQRFQSPLLYIRNKSFLGNSQCYGVMFLKCIRNLKNIQYYRTEHNNMYSEFACILHEQHA